MGSSPRLGSLPPTSTLTVAVTANAGELLQPRKRGKNTQLVKLGTHVGVLQAQLDVLQSLHGASSTELDNLYRKDWEGILRGLSEELRTMRRAGNSLLKYLAGHQNFRANVDNKFRKLLRRLKTLDAALQANALEKKEPRRSLKTCSSERSFNHCKRRDRRWSPIESSPSWNHSHRHCTLSEDSYDEPQRHPSSRSTRPEATLVEVGGLQRSQKHASLRELRPTNPLHKAALSYSYYRLKNSSLYCTPRGAGKVSDCIKWMALSLRNHYLSEEDPIQMLDLLAPFVSGANILGRSDGQA